jgi:ribonuclease-3
LRLGDLLFLSHGEQESGGRQNTSLLADVFEALLGALFLDQGIDAAKTFLESYLFPKTEEIINKKSYLDYKSQLQELVQEKTRISPTYVVTKSEGPDHAKVFWIEVRQGTDILGNGTGKSKQEAEQAAAKKALEGMAKT